jgi:hypothetical protein
MIALNGPFEGKEYRDVPDETKQIIDHYRDYYVTKEMLEDPNYYPIHKVVYNRTENGWVMEK